MVQSKRQFQKKAISATLSAAVLLVVSTTGCSSLFGKHASSAADDTAYSSQKLKLYSEGQAFEREKKWDDAIRVYRLALELTSSFDPQGQAQILHRLLICYEELGQDDRVVATLFDLKGRARYLAPEVARLEIPARLAMVYTRRGDLTEAERHYNEFELNLKSFQSAGEAMLPRIVPQLLVELGSLSLRHLSADEVKNDGGALGHAQTFLLKAARANDPTWSPRAVNALIQLYSEGLNLIESVVEPPGDDPLVSAVSKQNEQKKMASSLFDRLMQLKASQTEEGVNSPFEQKLFSELESFESRIAAIIESRPVNEGLTEEAKAREGLRRDGIVRDSQPVFPGETQADQETDHATRRPASVDSPETSKHPILEPEK